MLINGKRIYSILLPMFDMIKAHQINCQDVSRKVNIYKWVRSYIKKRNL